MSHKVFLIICAIVLALIPFLWLTPGAIDLGGDSSRLYFYDPFHYLKSFPLYVVAPNGFNTENIATSLIPFTLFLSAIQKVLQSGYLITTLFNSLILAGAFLSIFGIVVRFFSLDVHKTEEKTNIYLAALLGAFFYTFSPILTASGWWTTQLVTHQQFFLNPLMFFLLLSYIAKKDVSYLLVFLLLSFIFSPNFYLSPYFFSFYPIALLFLLIYTVFILRVQIRYKELVIAVVLFISLQALHFFPFMFDLFKGNTDIHQLVFSETSKFDRGLSYFLGVEQATKITNNLLGLPQGNFGIFHIYTFWIIVPALVLIGLIMKKKIAGDTDKRRSHTFLLLLLFFLATLYLVTAKITYGGLELYKSLFAIPGFGMFRNYVGQFSHVFIFFYALVFSFASFYIFEYLKSINKKRIVFAVIGGLFVIGALFFIRGDPIKMILNPGAKEGIAIPIKISSQYEQTLKTIRENPFDGKYLLLPIDDSGLQVLRGEDGGYVGPPTIAYLGEKSVFSGLVGITPFYKTFLSMVFNKDDVGIGSLLSHLNIKYIFYNSDDKIYGDNFSGRPYEQAKRFMPLTQDLYGKFLDHLPLEKRIDLDETYHIYELSSQYYRPHIYVADQNAIFIGDSISAVSFPLPFEDRNRRVSLHDGKSSQADVDTLYIQPKRKSILLDTYAKKEDHVSVSSSVSQEMYIALHPLLAVFEKIASDEARKSLKINFDKGAYELQELVKNLGMQANEQNLDSESFKNEMGKYKEITSALLDVIRTDDTILYSPFINMVKLNKLVISDKNRMYSLIEQNEKLSDSEKKNISESINETFSDIEQSISRGATIQRDVRYALFIPETGEYELFVDNDHNVQEMASKTLQRDDYWTYMGRFEEEKKDREFILTVSENMDIANELLNIPVNELKKGTSYLVNMRAQGLLLGMMSNIIGDVTDWEENTLYIISFEYKPKNTSSWKKYKAIIETGDQTKEALILLLNDIRKPEESIEHFLYPSDIDMQSLAIVSLPSPRIILKKEKSSTEKKIPTITFTKINPTKYEVKIKDANNPYTLVFLDAFNDKWKVFLKKEQEKDDKKVIASYYNGEVNEGEHNNTFFDLSTFGTWWSKPIAQAKHMSVNGYANAWYIEPSDVGEATDYTLILEMTAQRSLYILLPLSFISASVCILWLIAMSVKRKPHGT